MLSSQKFIGFLLGMVIMILANSGCSRQPADLILIGGKIITMNASQPQAQAVAVQGDRILFVGSAEGVKKYRGVETTIIQLKDSIILPGLVDAHAHLNSLGQFLTQLNLVGKTSKEQIRQMVIDKSQEIQPGDWIQGRGWDQNDWDIKEFPTWKDLPEDELHPVYLRRVDGHAAWVNKTALNLCGINRDIPDPEGGSILRDRNGDPTGVLIDNAIDLVTCKIPKPSLEERTRWIKAAIEKCHQVGLTGINDAGVDSIKLQIYHNLQRNSELNFRIYAMLDDTTSERSWLKNQLCEGPYESPDKMLCIRSIKLYADGALGSRGAALLEDYSDDPGNFGLLMHEPDFYYQTAIMALISGFQLNTHAIGDRGNRMILDVYARALNNHPVKDHRFRIEHAQIVHPQDIPRFAELGVIPSMQPTHATSDMDWVEKRLGRERLDGAYAWRKLLNSGCRIPCGSDFPVENPNPLWGIYAAVTRQDHSGLPEGGWLSEERMTVEEAVRGFTLDAAYASFAEDHMGSIEVGKSADFTILDQDIFTIPPEKILETRVIVTIVGGKIVYQAQEASTHESGE